MLQNLQHMRSDDQFALFWQRTACSADTLDIQEPKLPRRRQTPRRIDSGAEVTTYNEPVDCYFRSIYIHFVDCVAGCITARFSQPGVDICTKTERLVLYAFHGDLTETTFPTEFEKVTQHYVGDLDDAKLKMQMFSTSPAVVDESIVSVNQVTDKLFKSRQRNAYIIFQPPTARLGYSKTVLWHCDPALNSSSTSITELDAVRGSSSNLYVVKEITELFLECLEPWNDSLFPEKVFKLL